MKLLLISGHGAGDSGAIGNGLKEADKTRELVQLIEEQLRGSCNIEIYDMSKNCYKECKKGNIPNWKNYDYVLEFHFNAFNKRVGGTEVLISSNSKDMPLPHSILKNIENLKLFKNRGVKHRDNLLIMNLCKNANVKYLLLETCFIDSKDMKKYESNKISVVKAISNSIVESLGLIYPTDDKSKLYRVQVGAFNVRTNAEKLVKDLISKGYSAFIKEE